MNCDLTAQKKKKKKKKRSPSLDSVVVLVSEESESQSSPGSESESQPKSKPASESESDGLESWMILGGGRQEEDSSIQLNLEGGAHSNAGGCVCSCVPVITYVGCVCACASLCNGCVCARECVWLWLCLHGYVCHVIVWRGCV